MDGILMIVWCHIVGEVSLFEPVQRLGRVQPGVSQDLGASYLSPANRANFLNMQFSELEGATFQYKPLFCEYSYKLVGLVAQHVYFKMLEEDGSMVQMF